MNSDLERLERRLNADLQLLQALVDPRPTPLLKQRIVAGMAAALRASQRSPQRLGYPLLGAAAAVLLTLVGWYPAGSGRAESLSVDPETTIDRWVAALDHTSGLLSEDWMLYAGAEGSEDELDRLDELLNDLNSALELGT